MLNQEEFIFYGNGNKNPIQLTPLAVSRLFEENLYYRGSKELGNIIICYSVYYSYSYNFSPRYGL